MNITDYNEIYYLAHQFGFKETSLIRFGVDDLHVHIRKATITQLAQEIVGVQPMTSPVGQIFTMRSKYKC